MNAMLEMFLKVLVMLNADVNLKCQATHNLFKLTGLNFKIIHPVIINTKLTAC